jgi:hypothetical protein
MVAGYIINGHLKQELSFEIMSSNGSFIFLPEIGLPEYIGNAAQDHKETRFSGQRHDL